MEVCSVCGQLVNKCDPTEVLLHEERCTSKLNLDQITKLRKEEESKLREKQRRCQIINTDIKRLKQSSLECEDKMKSSQSSSSKIPSSSIGAYNAERMLLHVNEKDMCIDKNNYNVSETIAYMSEKNVAYDINSQKWNPIQNQSIEEMNWVTIIHHQ